jgi:hypothetical protein
MYEVRKKESSDTIPSPKTFREEITFTLQRNAVLLAVYMGTDSVNRVLNKINVSKTLTLT